MGVHDDRIQQRLMREVEVADFLVRLGIGRDLDELVHDDVLAHHQIRRFAELVEVEPDLLGREHFLAKGRVVQLVSERTAGGDVGADSGRLDDAFHAHGVAADAAAPGGHTAELVLTRRNIARQDVMHGLTLLDACGRSLQPATFGQGIGHHRVLVVDNAAGGDLVGWDLDNQVRLAEGPFRGDVSGFRQPVRAVSAWRAGFDPADHSLDLVR